LFPFSGPGIEEVPQFVIVEVHNATVDCRNDGIVRKIHVPERLVVTSVHDMDGAWVWCFGVIDHCDHSGLFTASNHYTCPNA
jgi:hypothetical protein